MNAPSKIAATRTYRKHNTSVGLADLVEALVAFRRPGDDVAGSVAGILGFALQPDTPRSEVAASTPSKITPPHDRPRPTKRLQPRVITPSESRLPLLGTESRESRLEMMFSDPALDHVAELAAADPQIHRPRPSYRPLLHDNWFRGIAIAALSVETDSREVDVAALEREIVRAQPLETLPWLQRPSVHCGVQLLIDRSDRMQPFWRDQMELAERLEKVMGRSHVETRYFAEDPRLGAGEDPTWDWRPLNRLTPDRPLLIVSDFAVQSGIRRAELGPWNWLLQLARRFRCPVSTLIPLRESCWPTNLKRAFPRALVWDRSTSPQLACRVRNRVPSDV